MNGTDLHTFCDTNVAVYLLSGDENLAELLHGMEAKISFITELELLSKPQITVAETASTKAFINQCTIVELSPAIKKKVIELRQRVKIKLPDEIIATSAIVMSLPLITADKQLEKIPGLDTILILR